MKKLSIIIPAYRAEGTIEKCIESVLANHTDLEVLVVDDGSDDSTSSVASAIAVRDSRVRVWCRQNAGPGAAREFALSMACGEYITFVDADDYVECGFYDNVFDDSDHLPDILEYGYIMEHVDGSVDLYHPMAESTCEGAECGQYYARQLNTTNFLWNKIIRRDLFKKVVFPHLYLGEDAAVLAQLFVFARSYRAIGAVGYHYVVTPNSLCRMPFSMRKLDGLKAYHLVDGFYIKCAPALCIYARHKLCSLAVLLYCECSADVGAIKFLPELMAEYNESRKSFTLKQLLGMGSFSRRIMLALFEISPRLCAKIYAWRQAL